MTATACCKSNSIIYQIQLIKPRSQFTPILPRTTLSSSSSPPSISEIHTPTKLYNTSRTDVNNNNNKNNLHQITNINIQQSFDNEMFDEEQFLALVGLQRKTKTTSVYIPTLPPLAKRLAAPVCLLPLPKHDKRVRQALYILLPFLKFLSITNDTELFCSTDDNAKADSLLPRSVTQTRSSKTINKTTNKRKVSKSEFISMAANTFRNTTRRTPMAKYIHSTIQCQVVLDRLEQSAIAQIMQNSIENDETSIATTSKRKRTLRHSPEQEIPSLPKIRRSLSQTTTKTTTTRTTITTMTTEKTTVKHKSTKTCYNDSKRFKPTSDNDCILTSDDNNNNTPISTYQRIYLKCFVCSKREYIDVQETNSDILHSHWLEHGNDLLLNIYDSEIDSLLTRVVEFFCYPEIHSLEGKVQTIFILNSNEIRKTSSAPLDDDSCIVID